MALKQGICEVQTYESIRGFQVQTWKTTLEIGQIEGIFVYVQLWWKRIFFFFLRKKRDLRVFEENAMGFKGYLMNIWWK